MDRIEIFRNNPKNSKFFNNGNNNISIDGNSNNITINHYAPEKVKVKIEDHQYNELIHITKEQQASIREKINEIGDMFSGVSNKNYYSFMFSKLKKIYKVPKYSLIDKINYDDVMKFLNKEFHILRRGELKSRSATRFKEITIPLIHIRWNYMRKNEDLFSFASEKLKKEVNSLYSLSVNDIDTLYTRVYSLRKRRLKK